MGGARSGPVPRPGRDIHLRVDVPASIAEAGGTVTLRYPRLRRTEDGRGSTRYDEIHDLRVPPGTRHGSTLRVPRMGDAGSGGGPYGDLVCDITVVAVAAGSAGAEQRARGVRRDRDAGPADRGGRADAGAGGSATGDAEIVVISVVEALLGGRVRVETPAGPVHITVPPCTDGGTRLRLRGRGVGGADHYVELRIKTPARLDAESRALIERFAELNPEEPG
ncbi:MAG: J domain-containing protein [Deltaproteobacteria bacterium]|nr:MAG: J domain-containing protein [Deltaproteobacteria bacterium]